MSSGCYNCAKSFSLLNREKGCKNCGFSFCGSCLRHQIPMPKAGGGPEEKAVPGKVCGACYRALSVASSSTDPASSHHLAKAVPAPPDALQKRMAALAKLPPDHAITVYRENQKMASLKEGLSGKDMEIANRLGRLKSERKVSMEIPTDEELSDRLAKLKGLQETASPPRCSAVRAPRNSLPAPDRRTQAEQADDLVERMRDEVRLDVGKGRPEDEISERLARLRGQGTYGSTTAASDPGTPATTPVDPVDEEDPKAELQRLLDEVLKDVGEGCLKGRSKATPGELRSGRGARAAATPGNEDDDDDEAEKILEQLLAEQKLSKSPDDDVDDDDSNWPGQNFRTALKSGQRQANRQVGRALSEQGRKSSQGGHEEEELPWCTICNEDATFRCLGCDGDLFCSPCFKECHDQLDLSDHQRLPFRAQKTKE